MSYLGNQPAANFASVTKDAFSGDGSTVAFTLSKASTTNGVAVFVENVRQEPTTAYSVSGTTLTFTAAPVSASGNNIYVLHHNAPASTATHPATQDLTAVNGTFTGTVSGLDINGTELILDADGDSSVRADTDDQIDFKAGNIIRASVISTGLQIGGTAYFASPTLTLKDPDSGVGAGTVGGKIDFHTMDSTAAGISATVKVKYEDANGNTSIAFDTGSGGSTSEKMRIKSAGDLSLQKNTSGFGNITSFGTVTLADDATVAITSGTHAGGANHLYVYETGTGSNAVYYGGYNKAAVLNGNYLETGGIGFAATDSDGNVSFFSDGAHALTFKNREGSSKTFKLMKVGVGATFNDTV